MIDTSTAGERGVDALRLPDVEFCAEDVAIDQIREAQRYLGHKPDALDALDYALHVIDGTADSSIGLHWPSFLGGLLAILLAIAVFLA